MEAEFDELDKKGLWGLVYERIRNEATVRHDFNLLSAREARNPNNRQRNRYRDVSPYDHSRVKLKKGNNDYINGSLVISAEANRRYILTQGPLPATMGHFWQMIWEQKTKAVIMLNRVIEKGTIKCSQYFPVGAANGGHDEMIFEDVDIRVTYLSEKNFSYYTVKVFELEEIMTGATREILHFHYTTWPDFGVPQSPAAFLNFLVAVRQSGALESDVGPAAIHCSAGIGRSGTFCLVDTCLVIIDKTSDVNSVNIKEILIDMRKYRMGLIQTPDQLRFSYLAIIEGSHRIAANTLNHLALSEEIPGLPETSGNSSDEVPPPLPPRRKPRTPEENGSANANPGPIMEDTQVSKTFDYQCPLKALVFDSARESEVRRRKREDRKRNTAEQIERMKLKQKEAEAARSRQPTFKSYLVMGGISLAVLIGSYVYYHHWYDI